MSSHDARHTAMPVSRYQGGSVSAESDQLVVEAPLEIRLGNVAVAVLMRTPGDDADLVRGFALTEGMALRPGEITGVAPIGPPEEGRLRLELSEGVAVDPEQFRRNLYATSSCGVCGKASIDAVRMTATPLPPGPMVRSDQLQAMAAAMRRAQATFDLTGGLHAAAAFTPSGDLLVVREDIGRHNAVDKVIGHLAPTDWPLHTVVLLVSGRVSFEIVQKAALAGIPVVGGVSAASSLAVELGSELGMTVIGFLRSDGFNVYVGSERLDFES